MMKTQPAARSSPQVAARHAKAGASQVRQSWLSALLTRIFTSRKSAAKAAARPAASGPAAPQASTETRSAPAALNAECAGPLAAITRMLNRHPQTRAVMRHMSRVEIIIRDHGLDALLQVEVSFAAQALEQFDIALGGESLSDDGFEVRRRLQEVACRPPSQEEIYAAIQPAPFLEELQPTPKVSLGRSRARAAAPEIVAPSLDVFVEDASESAFMRADAEWESVIANRPSALRV